MRIVFNEVLNITSSRYSSPRSVAAFRDFRRAAVDGSVSSLRLALRHPRIWYTYKKDEFMFAADVCSVRNATPICNGKQVHDPELRRSMHARVISKNTTIFASMLVAYLGTIPIGGTILLQFTKDPFVSRIIAGVVGAALCATWFTIRKTHIDSAMKKLGGPDTNGGVSSA